MLRRQHVGEKKDGARLLFDLLQVFWTPTGVFFRRAAFRMPPVLVIKFRIKAQIKPKQNYEEKFLLTLDIKPP